jgi:hypothetical protein
MIIFNLNNLSLLGLPKHPNNNFATFIVFGITFECGIKI